MLQPSYPFYVMVCPNIQFTRNSLLVKIPFYCEYCFSAYRCTVDCELTKNIISLPTYSPLSLIFYSPLCLPLPPLRCLPTPSPPSNPQQSKRAALQQTDVKPCIRSSTDRCRRRGSRPTAWSSLSPTSACEYLQKTM